jgi:hypothetical protein
MGIEITTGKREDNVPGQRIAFPSSVDAMGVTDVDLARLRRSYLRRIGVRVGHRPLEPFEMGFLAEDLHVPPELVAAEWAQLTASRDAVGTTSGGAGG